MKEETAGSDGTQEGQLGFYRLTRGYTFFQTTMCYRKDYQSLGELVRSVRSVQYNLPHPTPLCCGGEATYCTALRGCCLNDKLNCYWFILILPGNRSLVQNTELVSPFHNLKESDDPSIRQVHDQHPLKMTTLTFVLHRGSFINGSLTCPRLVSPSASHTLSSCFSPRHPW